MVSTELCTNYNVLSAQSFVSNWRYSSTLFFQAARRCEFSMASQTNTRLS